MINKVITEFKRLCVLTLSLVEMKGGGDLISLAHQFLMMSHRYCNVISNIWTLSKLCDYLERYRPCSEFDTMLLNAREVGAVLVVEGELECLAKA